MSMAQEQPITKTRQSARVFMGPIASREADLDALEIQSMHDWRKRFEIEYMERVKVRAAAYVQTMYVETNEKTHVIRQNTEDWVKKREGAIDKTYEDAIGKHQLSETLLQQAQERYDTSLDNGYKDGVEKAMLEMEAHRQELDTAYVSVLRAIEEQCDNIFATWRQDLVTLLIDSVEASVSWTLTKDRRQTFEALFDNAVQQLTDQRRLRVKVHPDDATLVQDVLHQAKARFPELSSWNVDVSTEVTAGSLSVESHTGRANNDIQYRLAKLQEILQYLELPHGEAEEAAKEAVAQVDAEAGIPALVEAINERMPDEPELTPDPTPEAIPNEQAFADDGSLVSPVVNPETNLAAPEAVPNETLPTEPIEDEQNTLQGQDLDNVENSVAESAPENFAENADSNNELVATDEQISEAPTLPEELAPKASYDDIGQNPTDQNIIDQQATEIQLADGIVGDTIPANPLHDLEDELLQDLENHHVTPFLHNAEASASPTSPASPASPAEQQTLAPDLSDIETIEAIEASNAQHPIIHEEHA